MNCEIERKFLVDPARWKRPRRNVAMVQGYLVRQNGLSLRVRLAGARAYLTIKGPTHGLCRSEFEYPIPAADARKLLAEFKIARTIRKTRYYSRWRGHLWEIDVFDGDNAGLIVAEIELARPDEPFELPPWATREVSGDPRYRNTSLIEHPWCEWGARERVSPPAAER